MANNSKTNFLDLCETEVYFDESVGCNVTLIKSAKGVMSPSRFAANERAEYLGFDDIYHREGYLYFNRLNNEQYDGHSVDVLHLLSGGNGLGN